MQMFGDSPLQAINRQTYNSFQSRVRPPPWRQRKAKSFNFCHCLLSICCLNKVNRKKLRVVLSCTNRKMILLTPVLILHTLKLNLVQILSFTFKADLSCTQPKSKPCPTSLQHVQTQRLVRPLFNTFKLKGLSDLSSTRSNSKACPTSLQHVQTQRLVRPLLHTFNLKGLSDLSSTRSNSKACPTSLQHVQTQRLVRPLLHTFKMLVRPLLHTFKRFVRPLVHVQTQSLVRPSL